MNSLNHNDLLSRAVAEAGYQEARAELEQAQALRNEAVCRFLEAQARCRMATLEETDADLCDEATYSPADALSQAESEVRQAKILFCAVLEQKHEVQWMVSQLRMAYQRAQRNLDRLAVEKESRGSDATIYSGNSDSETRERLAGNHGLENVLTPFVWQI